MTYNNANDIVDHFLSTLDAFGITSDIESDENFLATEALTEYWYHYGGVIYVEE